MDRQRIIGFALLVACVVASLVSPVVAAQAESDPIIAQFGRGDSKDQIGIRPSQTDFLGEGPQALVVSQGGEFYILDTLNNRIIRHLPASHQTSIIPLPATTGAFDLAVQTDNLYILDGVNLVVIQMDLSGKVLNTYPIDPTEIGALSSQIAVTQDGTIHWQIQNRKDYILAPGTARPVSSEASGYSGTAVPGSQQLLTSSRRTGSGSGSLLIHQANGGQLLALDIQVNQYLGSASLIAIDDSDNYYVLVEELQLNVGSFVVETTVWKFSPDGVHLGTARVPLEKNDLLPHRFVAVSPDGLAYFLAVQSDVAVIYLLEFTTNYVSQLPTTPIPDLAAYPFETPSTKPKSGIESISRSQIMQNAEAYLNANWTLGSANYHTGPSNDWTGCGTSEHWRLPRYLSGRLNQVIAEVPYEYGGKVSVATFQARIQSGYWAGNICSEGGDIPQATGIDCSGFVQNCWQTNQQYLPNVSHVIGWQELREGDLLFKETHSILFEDFINGSDISGGAFTYESTMTSTVDRVIHWTRTYSDLSSYTPRRYNDVSEDPPQMIPAHQNVVLNPSFDTNNLTNWWQWGDVDYAFYGNGYLFFKRHTGGSGGCIGQNITYYVPYHAPLELTLQLGNTSPVVKTPGIFIRSGDHWDIGCHFSIPPYSPLQTYIIRGFPQADWYGFNIEVWPDPPDGIPDVLMDNVTLTYRPELTISGTECLAASDPSSYLAQTAVPMFRGNPLRNGVSSYSAPVKPGLIWSIAGNDKATSPVIGENDVIYLGMDNSFFAIAPNGTILWRYDETDRFVSSAAITTGGNIYVANNNGLLYTFNSGGQLLWTYNLGGWTTSAPAIGADGTVYVGSSDYKMRALTPQGNLIWEYSAASWIQSSPAIGADGTIYFGSADNTLYALNRLGSLKWSFPASTFIDSAPAIGPDGTVYFGDVEGAVYALNPDTGAQKWKITTGGMLAVDSLTVASDGTIYFAVLDRDPSNGYDEETRLYALRSNGSVKWYYTFARNPSGSPVVTANGSILISADDGKLYLLNPAGGLIWSYSLENYDRWLRGSPAINSKDQVFLISSWPAKLYALGEASNQLFVPIIIK